MDIILFGYLVYDFLVYLVYDLKNKPRFTLKVSH